MSIPRVLSIAGSDSGAGAGIQADLKAFAACGVHGMTAITAITAQNTVGVAAVHSIPPEVIVAQVRAVADDIGVDAVKIGMLGDRPTIEAVAQALDELPDGTPVVLDPVMVAESGAQLLDPAAKSALIDLLFPRATVVTPNVPEARTLVDDPGEELAVEDLAKRVHALGPEAVVVTGGHRDDIVDVFFDGDRLVKLHGERHPDGATHGSGCTHSSVLAARLAHGDHAARGSPRGPRARLPSGGAGASGARCRRWPGRHPGDCLQTGRLANLGRSGRPGPGARVWHNPSVRFLRMKPGHGEVLIAEGDVERAEDEQRLIEEFRRQLDAGLWAAVPVADRDGRRESIMVRSFEDIPWDADRVIFFPRAAGGR